MNLTNYPVELAEAEYPIQVLSYALVPDSGGPGRHRGGLAIKKEFRVLMERAILTIRSDRRNHPPWGLFGGGNGAASWNIINPGPAQRILRRTQWNRSLYDKATYSLILVQAAAASVIHSNAILAWWLQDVIEEKETTSHARQTYGVIIDGKSMSVDHESTIALRRKMQTSA